jgi:hypothetical protein
MRGKSYLFAIILQQDPSIVVQSHYLELKKWQIITTILYDPKHDLS